jgi:membrane protein YqaA with SNARE-associated domain
VNLQHFYAWFLSALPILGGVGLLVAALVDCSFLPLPLVTDLLLIELSSRHPARMPYYAAMATAGSLAGCLCVYWLARKGGEAYYRKKQGHPPGMMRRLVQRHPLASVFFPAIAPFPVPFKPFVIAQGVFQVPVPAFLVGTLLGRGCLFVAEGLFGARYGEDAKQFLLAQKWASIGVFLAIILLVIATRRILALRESKYSQAD